jgi:glycolate oxidase FAD binding subunit
MSDAFVQELQERVRGAQSGAQPVLIQGGGTKAFYGGASPRGDVLDMRAYCGIIDYQPRELVLTVKAGTPIQEIDAALDAQSQMLAFEPPQFAQGGTLGGAVASGLSGPRRAYVGAVRDFVLGTRIINGKGEDLRFGGRVIKNVAGYDVSRLMAGAMGTLGVLLDVSLKVLPKPVAEVTLCFSFDQAAAIQKFNEWAGQPIPLSATAWHDGIALVRLSGTEAGVSTAVTHLGGERMDADTAIAFWAALRDQQHDFFQGCDSLWRLSVPATTPPVAVPGAAAPLVEWGGAQRWLRGSLDASALRTQVAALGGHVTIMRRADRASDAAHPVFHPLHGKLAELNRNLKLAFDPANILNRGRLDNF